MKSYVNSQADHLYLVESSKAKKGQYLNVSLLLDSGKRFMESLPLAENGQVFAGCDYMPLDDYMRVAYGCKKANEVALSADGNVTVDSIVYGTMNPFMTGQVRLTTRKDWRQSQSTYTFENFNSFFKAMAVLDIEDIAYNAGW